MGQVQLRDFLLAASASSLLACLPALAQQQGKVWRVGFLSARAATPSVNAVPAFKAFLDGMQELGYFEGKNLVVEWRFGEGKYERLLDHASELARIKVDVIVTDNLGTTPAQKATTSVPIVGAVMDDPVGAGYAASLAKPGGNITGLSPYSSEFVAKFLELIMTAVPKVSRVAVLSNPGAAMHSVYLNAIKAAAQKSKVTVLPMSARTAQEIEQSYVRMSRERANAAIILPDAFYLQQVGQLAGLAIMHHIPSIWGGRPYPAAGGLMSYGFANTNFNYFRAATFVDKILKGAKPGDLPIELPTRYELVINRKTAKALGLNIPQTLLLQATEVIE
jgi:putative ABC transport system substrate-binding protein